MTKTRYQAMERLHPVEFPWLSIRVTLISRGDRCLVPPPERTLVASPWHTFADLALAIDEVFCCWEQGDLRELTLRDGTRVGDLADEGGQRHPLDYRRTRLQRLRHGEEFGYVVSAGERWVHKCVLMGALDSSEVLADRPGHPFAYQTLGRPPAAAVGASRRLS